MADDDAVRTGAPELSAARVRTDDWPAQATDTIVKVVGTAHDKITGPIQTAARAVVYGLLALLLGSGAIVLVAVLLIRIANNYLPDAVVGERHVWAAHLLVGLIFSLLGLVAWSKRSARPDAG